MPDWSYQTVFRPLLFRALSPQGARDLALRCMGMLSRMPLGSAVIDFLGHMRPDPRLSLTLGGITFPGRVGLGALVDPHVVASRGLARFGIGFLEIGPVSIHSQPEGRIDRNDSQESLTFHFPAAVTRLDASLREIQQVSQAPILARLNCDGMGVEGVAAAGQIIEQLGKRVGGYLLQSSRPASATAAISQVAGLIKSKGRLVWLVISHEQSPALAHEIVSLVSNHIVDGILIEGHTIDAEGNRHVGRANYPQTLDAVRTWRAALSATATIMASGGIHEPVHAIELIDAGCDLLNIDSGLIFSGPGLIKRINECLLFRHPVVPDEPSRPERLSWFWTCLMSIGMLIGGVLAVIIASTRVVMPYDEAMCGLTRDEIHRINQHLLHFMSHDRVTLAGTMLAVGILYFALSVFGSRRGMHWARRAIILSASAGFASFFLFLGFGYFDPFHAFVTAVLFQLLVMAIHCDLPRYRALVAPELINDRAWRISQWGQLLFIIHGALLIVAGSVIASFGVTTVFVPEDLEFMRTTAEQLFGAHPSLVPLIAHDRATFGGMLISCGVCVLLSSLWGFRRGHAWLWWALVLAGTTAYLATISIHWHVGYSSLKHLLPAYAGLGMIILGGALSRDHLCGSEHQ